MTDNDVATYEGTALPLEASHELANAFAANVVLIMGEKSAGKTTLLAELHHAFLRAPFAGFIFAGSKTLIGFEERCFLSRMHSGQMKEDTERTKYADIRLLHMALAPETSPARHTHLLLTDVSGERFKEIRSSEEEARELAPLVRRADHIVLLIDGDCLTTSKTQMATQTNAAILLRCLLEAGGLDGTSSLHIVVSKWDQVVARSAQAHVEQLEKSILKVAPTLTPLFHRIAARVTDETTVAPGFGLDGLVQGWMRPQPRGSLTSATVDAPHADVRLYGQYRFPTRSL